MDISLILRRIEPVTATSERIGLESLPLPYPQTTQTRRHNFAFQQLSEAFRTAKIVPFDDTSRVVFFSDLHRGDNSRSDAFAPNKPLFLHALTHYLQRGFTYVEVGDGDELWKNRRFSDIRHAHRCVFDLLGRFQAQDRLHMIVGNHDIGGSRRKVEKDGLSVEESIVMRHTDTGQQLFVVHGHQADFVNDRLYFMSRFLVRYLWRSMEQLGLTSASSRPRSVQKRAQSIEQRIVAWVEAHRQIVICGHTHQPRSTRCGRTAYFNTGSCVVPGYVTGLELQDGALTLVKWSSDAANGNGRPGVRREVIAAPKRISTFLR